MSEFVIGRELASAVRRISRGADLRCAVAFWGRGARDFLAAAGAETSQAKIVCDLSMGGCHPDALVELGAPGSDSVRHHTGLHAKVYLSNEGALIGSANASNNGLGFRESGAVLTEAATFHECGSAVWESASSWFDELYASSHRVDEAALERARLIYRPSHYRPPGTFARRGSLLDLIRTRPDLFEGIGFVFCSEDSTDDQRKEARRAAIKAGISRDLIEGTSDHDMFVGWGERDVRRWPVSFIEFWKPGRRLHLYARTVTALDPVAGNVFAPKTKRALRKQLPAYCPDFHEAEKVDAELAQRLIADGGAVYRSGREVAQALQAAEAAPLID